MYHRDDRGFWRSHDVAKKASNSDTGQVFPTSAAQMASLLGGRTPDWGYLFNEESSPAVEAFGAGEDLVQAGDPTFGVATGHAGASAVEFSVNDTNNIKPVSTSFADFTTGSFAHLLYVQFTTKRTAGSGGFMGKNPSSNPRYLAQVSTGGYLSWQIHDGSTLKNTNIAQNTDGIETWVWLGCDRTADLLYLYTRQGLSTLSISGLGSITNAQPVRFGNLSSQSTGFKLGAWYGFSGSDAEGDPSSDIGGFASYLS